MEACQNPNCKSHGVAHPNCRCEPAHAEAEHFAEGGMADLGFVPDGQPAPLSDQFSPTSDMGFVPDDQEAAKQDKYGGLGQQAIAGLEGLGKGAVGPLSTLAEKSIGVPTKDIVGREEANPITHAIGEGAGLLAGVESGQLGALKGVAEHGAELLGLTGAKAVAVKLGVENALYTLGDEVSKVITNNPDSIQTAAAHVGLSGLLGAGTGFAFGKASELAQKVFSPKTEGFVKDFVDTLKSRNADTLPEEVAAAKPRAGIDPFTKEPLKAPEEAYPPNPWPMDPTPPTPRSAGHRAASKMADYLSNAAAEAIADSAGAAIGHMTGIPGAGTLGAYIGHNSLKPLVKTLLPSIIKPLLNNEASAVGLKAALEAVDAIAKGESAINDAAQSLFHEGSKDSINELVPDPAKVHKLEERIGELSNDPNKLMKLGGGMAHYMPEHQTALATTAQTAMGYLSAQRPQPTKPGVLNAFIEPTKAQMSAYHRTAQIAEQPLVLFNFLHKGTLSPKDVRDLGTLYPALHQNMIQKVNNHMIDSLSRGKSVPFKLRRGLSMLMGQPLDSTFSPASTQAAQATFAPIAPQQPPGAPSRRGSPSKVGKASEMAQTPVEARIKALQKA